VRERQSDLDNGWKAFQVERDYETAIGAGVSFGFVPFAGTLQTTNVQAEPRLALPKARLG
jgi:hypothetical protein